jgi:hypothetical protein
VTDTEGTADDEPELLLPVLGLEEEEAELLHAAAVRHSAAAAPFHTTRII